MHELPVLHVQILAALGGRLDDADALALASDLGLAPEAVVEVLRDLAELSAFDREHLLGEPARR